MSNHHWANPNPRTISNVLSPACNTKVTGHGRTTSNTMNEESITCWRCKKKLKEHKLTLLIGG